MFKLYVGNFKKTMTEEAIRTLFAQHGPVNEIIMVTEPRSGKPVGYAFVLVPDETVGREMVAKLQGTEMEGKKLTINVAGEGVIKRPKPPRKPQRFRRRTLQSGDMRGRGFNDRLGGGFSGNRLDNDRGLGGSPSQGYSNTPRRPTRPRPFRPGRPGRSFRRF